VLFTSSDRSRPSPQPEGASALAVTPSRSAVVAPRLTPAVAPPPSGWVVVGAPPRAAWGVGARAALAGGGRGPGGGWCPPRDQLAWGPTEPRTSNGGSVSGRAAP